MTFGLCMKTKTGTFGSARETVSPATILLLHTVQVQKPFPFCDRRSSILHQITHPQKMRFGAFFRIKRKIFGSELTRVSFATTESPLLAFCIMTASSTTAVSVLILFNPF